MNRKFISLLLSACMITGMMGMPVFAEEINIQDALYEDILNSDSFAEEIYVEETAEAVNADVEAFTDADAVVDSDVAIIEVPENDDETVETDNDAAPVSIVSADDLSKMMTDLSSSGGGDYILENDIDMTGHPWVMPAYNPLSFDGNNHTISNLTITHSVNSSTAKVESSSLRAYGMFNNTNVSNLTLHNTTINLNGTGGSDYYFGTIIGAGSADKCKLTGTTKYTSDTNTAGYYGGIVGAARGNVTDCILDGTLDCQSVGADYVGGIVGAAYTKYSGLSEITEIGITGCRTTKSAVVKAGKMYTSGIISFMNGSSATTQKIVINNCVNNAALIPSSEGANPYVTGIVGTKNPEVRIEINNCVNNADLEYKTVRCSAFGILGMVDNAAIKGCVNNGNITSYSCAGIVNEVRAVYGKESRNSIVNCVNTGKVTAENYAEGIAHSLTNTSMTGCVNTGDITCPTNNASGIACAFTVGEYGSTNVTVSINKCFNTGTVRAKNEANGLVGRINLRYNNPTADISDCFNSGIVCGYKESEYRYGDCCGLFGEISYDFGSTTNDNATVRINRCYNSGAVYKNYEFSNVSLGNQIIRRIIKGSKSGYVFEESNCYFVEDEFAKKFTKPSDLGSMSCTISEAPVAEADFAGKYSSNSDIWGSGKTGYPYPYLKGICEDKLPTSFSHESQVQKLKDIMSISVAKDETKTVLDSTGKAHNFVITTKDGKGEKVPVDLSTAVASLGKVKGDKVKLPTAKKMKITGYTFKGWYVNNKKVTKLSLKKLDENVTLEAVYKVNQYTIKYSVKKPAKGVKVIGKIASHKKIDYTDSIFIKGSEVSAEGYELVGFSKTKKSTVVDYKVSDDVPVALFAPKKKTITLYAVWAPKK